MRIAWLALLMATPVLGAQPANEPPSPGDAHTVKILRTTNKAQTRSYVPVVVDMARNNPFNVIRFLHRPIQTEEGLLYTFVEPDGEGGKVLFVVPEHMAESLSDLVEAVDRPGLTTGSGDARIYYPLKHRRAHVSDLNFLEPARSYTTLDGSTMLEDPERNALYFEDAPSGAESLQAALAEVLDVPTAMVQLVVKIYEIDAVNDAQIGLDYMAWKNGPGANLFAVGAFDEYSSINNVDGLSGGITVPPGYSENALGLPGRQMHAQGYNYAYQYAVSSAFFDFLQVKGKARILNQAKLAALNTRPAVLTAGNQVLHYRTVTTRDPNGVRPTGEPFDANDSRALVATTLDSNLEPVETGLRLAFRPTIALETVKLDVEVEWSDVTGFDGTGFPQISERRFESDLDVTVGREIILGGFRRTARLKTAEKVPVLGSLPVIGYLFGGEGQQNKESEVIVAIRPVVVFDYAVARDYVIAEDDRAVIEQASDRAPIEMPATRYFFDQHRLDKAINTPVDAID